MARNGIIIHKGIQQVFTSGAPGTRVSGYDIDGNIFSGVPVNVNFNESFSNFSGAILRTASGVYTRNYYDPKNCAPECNTPNLASITKNCNSNTFTLLSTGVRINESPSTRIEVSRFSDFSSLITSSTRNNTTTGNNSYSINLSSFNIIPGTTIYFRLINICDASRNIESTTSNILSSVCEACCTPSLSFTTTSTQINLIPSFGVCSNIVAYMNVESSTNGGASWTPVQTNTSTQTYALPSIQTSYRIQSFCYSLSEYSNIVTYIPPVPPPPPPPPTTVRLNYSFLTNGGSSPGSININVDGLEGFNAKQSTNGSIDVPLGSKIDVEVNAPVGDTSSGDIFTFNSQLIVTTNSGDSTSNIGTTQASISFTASEETSISGRTSVGSGPNDEPDFV
jgi:hypothetical protein